MPPLLLLLVTCAAAACQGALAQEHKSGQSRKQTGAEEQEAAGSERLSLVSSSGWRPIIAGGREHRLPRTPSYAAPVSVADLGRSADKDQRNAKRDLSAEHVKEQDSGGRVHVVLPVGTRSPRDPPPSPPPPLPPLPPLPPRAAPWDRPHAAPITEPDDDVESAFGYRYPPPPVLGGPGLGLSPGPSPTAPFWEAAWLRRRERLLQELALPPPLPPPLPPCRCAAVDACLAAGYQQRLQADPYRLGVGPYGLYGAWGRPLHNHNSAPLGAAQLHDNPN
ncbi:hypothetical protein KUF71_001401 [Frankliniella fusca]|uniref:Uncharacterized protein n=1 Tax=Frankliniella fusca TaxID=407009 RepID=A0AAE1HL77_9NEOP|nr:hypothetical protein KUF71_001401 [Frankliniella fusca]